MLQAISISQTVKQRLQAAEFSGRVLSVHHVACNLVDEQREVIALAAALVGDGPFGIVVDAGFEGIAVGDAVWADTKELVAGEWTVQLDGAAVWEPRPDWPRLRADRVRIAQGFAALDEWTSPALWAGAARITGADECLEDNLTFMTRLARGKEAYSRLIAEGLGQGKQESLVEGARLLAGLGPGGTPAGDDFLVGVMAAMWLSGDEADARLIAETAAPRTSALSAAFLRAAGHGEFIAAWHALVGALAAGDPPQVEAAAKRVQNYGASSGADALEGFILAGRTLLSSKQEHINIRTRTNALPAVGTQICEDAENIPR